MEPLIVLVAVTALLLIAGAAGVRRLRDWHAALRGGLAAMFLFTGVSHFGAFGVRDDLVAMVPPALPAPELLVTVTGVLELAGAVALLLPRIWPWAAAGFSVLLVAMFPANIYKALEDPTLRASQELGPRTALQLIFLTATLTVLGRYLQARRRFVAEGPAASAGSDRPVRLEGGAPGSATSPDERSAALPRFGRSPAVSSLRKRIG
jgi:uncharacterized membrane protein